MVNKGRPLDIREDDLLIMAIVVNVFLIVPRTTKSFCNPFVALSMIKGKSQQLVAVRSIS